MVSLIQIIMAVIRIRHDFIAGLENVYVDKAIVYKNKLPIYKEILGLTDELIAESMNVLSLMISCLSYVSTLFTIS